jgi:predicted nucleic acid-binding protein
LGGLLPAKSAKLTRDLFSQLPIERYPHTTLADRIWGLRGNLTSWDAAYVALSEALEIPLITSDNKLAKAPGHNATIESYAR